MELIVAVGVISVLAALAMPSYSTHVARQQAAESLVLFDSVKAKTLQNVLRLGKCTESGTSETVYGKYGNLVASGTASSTAMFDSKVLQKTGCTFSYTLKAESSRVISGKMIAADLFNNGVLSNSSKTTVGSVYLPKSLITLVEGTKSVLNGDTPVTTPVSLVPQLTPDP